MRKDFNLVSTQGTLFTPDGIVSPTQILLKFLPKCVELFDGEPLVAPVPEGMPPEFPRVILFSSTGQWRCQIASSRIDFHWAKTEVEISPREVMARTADVLKDYVQSLDLRIGRLAAVIRRFADIENPGLYLARRFCKDNWLVAPFNRPENFELHAHKIFVMVCGFTVNSWVRNKTAEIRRKGSSEGVRGILLEQDINTLDEHLAKQSFSKEQIAEFLDSVSAEFDRVADLYYPTEQSGSAT